MSEIVKKQRKPAHEKKNSSAHEHWRETKRQSNASKGKQVFRGGKWVRGIEND